MTEKNVTPSHSSETLEHVVKRAFFGRSLSEAHGDGYQRIRRYLLQEFQVAMIEIGLGKNGEDVVEALWKRITQEDL